MFKTNRIKAVVSSSPTVSVPSVWSQFAFVACCSVKVTAPARYLFSRIASRRSTLPSMVVSPQLFSDGVSESVVTVVSVTVVVSVVSPETSVVSVVYPETSVVSVVSVTVVVSVVSPETSVVSVVSVTVVVSVVSPETSVVSVVVVVVGASGSLNETPELFA